MPASGGNMTALCCHRFCENQMGKMPALFKPVFERTTFTYSELCFLRKIAFRLNKMSIFIWCEETEERWWKKMKNFSHRKWLLELWKPYKHIAMVHQVWNPSWHFKWYLELWQIWFIWVSLQSCHKRSTDLVIY